MIVIAAREVRQTLDRPDVHLFASGGIRSGQDIAKCAALGADLDTPATGSNPSLIERGASDALRNAAEGVIPFRGWVRKLSGAERYSREVAAAIAAGTIRRAYLKGIGAAAGCAAPAAPRS